MDALIRERLRSFLDEDLSAGDVTSEALIDPDATGAGVVEVRQTGVLAGLHEAALLAGLVGLAGRDAVPDGAVAEAGTDALRIEGNLRAILGVERTLLNLVSHMSGIATATREAVAAVAGTGARIAATRKTLPGLRWFEKRAVVAGGGDPHRHDLGAAVLIKDNHLAVVGQVGEAVRRARARASFTIKIEIEVETAAEAIDAAEAGAAILLLDNMTPAQVADAVEALDRAGYRDRVLIEASGGISASSARAYAEAGAQLISMGGLTASAPALDLSLRVEPTR